MSRECEEIRPFEAKFRKLSGEYVHLAVSSVCICSDESAADLIVHVLRRVDRLPQSAEEKVFSTQLALLVSDIVESTQMMDRLGEPTTLNLIHEHNEILRACLNAYDGTEVQHTGDGLIASFDSPANAAHCAIAVQQDCARHNQRTPHLPLRLRIGLHSGLVQREEARWFGIAMNEAARVCGHAAGGEILITDHMAKQFEADGIYLKDRGEVQLRGIPQPIHIHEIDWCSSKGE
jgi:class 3 adenylate cyclase